MLKSKWIYHPASSVVETEIAGLMCLPSWDDREFTVHQRASFGLTKAIEYNSEYAGCFERIDPSAQHSDLHQRQCAAGVAVSVLRDQCDE